MEPVGHQSQFTGLCVKAKGQTTSKVSSKLLSKNDIEPDAALIQVSLRKQVQSIE